MDFRASPRRDGAVQNILFRSYLNPNNQRIVTFTVNGHKLLALLNSKSTARGKNNAEIFFANIMRTTSTSITWPEQLGARPVNQRRNATILIVGKHKDARTAKFLVLQYLGLEVIVTMNIVSPRNDHDSVDIENIMESTSTNICLPHPNQIGKTDEISICGSLANVELARSLIRACSPLVIHFEIPLLLNTKWSENYLINLARKFQLKVTLELTENGRTSVMIRGVQSNVESMIKGTKKLMDFLCFTNDIEVRLELHISLEYQNMLIDTKSTQIMDIMEKTQTRIMIRPADSLLTCQVIIFGKVDGVCHAKQQIIGILPVQLSFRCDIEEVDITELDHSIRHCGLNMSIAISTSYDMNVLMETSEICVGNIYDVYKKMFPNSRIVRAAMPIYNNPRSTIKFCGSLAPGAERKLRSAQTCSGLVAPGAERGLRSAPAFSGLWTPGAERELQSAQAFSGLRAPGAEREFRSAQAFSGSVAQGSERNLQSAQVFSGLLAPGELESAQAFPGSVTQDSERKLQSAQAFSGLLAQGAERELESAQPISGLLAQGAERELEPAQVFSGLVAQGAERELESAQPFSGLVAPGTDRELESARVISGLVVPDVEQQWDLELLDVEEQLSDLEVVEETVSERNVLCRRKLVF